MTSARASASWSRARCARSRASRSAVGAVDDPPVAERATERNHGHFGNEVREAEAPAMLVPGPKGDPDNPLCLPHAVARQQPAVGAATEVDRYRARACLTSRTVERCRSNVTKAMHRACGNRVEDQAIAHILRQIDLRRALRAVPAALLTSERPGHGREDRYVALRVAYVD